MSDGEFEKRVAKRRLVLGLELIAGILSFEHPGQALATPGHSATTYHAFVRRMASIPLAPPGFAVVVVKDNRILYEHAFGKRNAARPRSLTLETPIYIATTTAYSGLLGAELDRKGLFPLKTTLTAVWPQLASRRDLQPDLTTASQLLSHSSGIEDPGLIFRSNRTGEYDLNGIPRHLERYASASGKAFEYSNFGPFIYSMMTEQKLGQSAYYRSVGLQLMTKLLSSRTAARPRLAYIRPVRT